VAVGVVLVGRSKGHGGSPPVGVECGLNVIRAPEGRVLAEGTVHGADGLELAEVPLDVAGHEVVADDVENEGAGLVARWMQLEARLLSVKAGGYGSTTVLPFVTQDVLVLRQLLPPSVIYIRLHLGELENVAIRASSFLRGRRGEGGECVG
jgi:hypothetical protein